MTWRMGVLAVGTGQVAGVLFFQYFLTKLFRCLRLFEQREWSSHVNCWLGKFVGAKGNWRGWVFVFVVGFAFHITIT